MLLIREIMYCKPGKVRPLLEKFKAMAKLGEQKGWGKMRIYTDVGGEQYWTLIAEMEAETLEEFMQMGTDTETQQEFGAIMEGYHDLVVSGKREIFKVEY